jgi:hypothetical protein
VGGLRTALVGGFLAAVAWAAVPQVAQGATTTTTVASQPMSFAGTAADGTALTLGVQITDVIVSRFSPGHPTANPGGPGSDFLSLVMTTDESAGTGPSFDGFDTVPIESGDPVPADAVIAHVLTCAPASIVAWEDYLKVGSLLGGPREVERRLGVARHALGDDETLLEPLVRELAGDGS